MSFLRTYEAEMRKYTDAPDIFHRAASTSLLAAFMTRRRYRTLLHGGVPARWTNLWIFLVGDSAASRKSTCVSMANEVLTRMDRSFRAPDDGSPEGLVSHLVKRDTEARGDAATYFVIEELGSFFANMQRQYSSPMKMMLTDMFDVKPRFVRQLAQKELVISRPRISMFGGIATELLPEALTTSDWLGGFMSRSLIVFGKRTRTLVDPGTPSDTVYKRLADLAHERLEAWRRTRIRNKEKWVKQGYKEFHLSYAPDAAKLAHSFKVPKGDGTLTLVLGRASVTLMKLAAAEQVDLDPESPFITKAAVQTAAELWTQWVEGVPDLLEQCFARSNKDFEGDRVARRILRALRGLPDGNFQPLAILQRAIALDDDRFNKALTTLINTKLVEVRTREADGEKMVRAYTRDEVQKMVPPSSESDVLMTLDAPQKVLTHPRFASND